MLLFGYYKKSKMIGRKKTELEEIYDNLKELVLYKNTKEKNSVFRIMGF